mgnify:CR=1 FL=1
MDGFAPALDGHFDVADQVSRSLLARAEAHASRSRDRLAAIDSPEDVDAHREWVRSTLADRFGGLPDDPEPRSVETTGRRERDGYTLETVVIETLLGFHVTANCYVPDGDGLHPAVLFLCGHAEPAKADPANQRACVTLARHGFVVLTVDPVGQGERRQYRDIEVDGAAVSGGGGTFPHAYAGQKCFYAGANLARYVVHDDRCALTALLDRDDVDADRVAAVGTSGGGTQSMYLAVFDERVDAVAPCCAVSERYEQLKTGNRTHAEQAITGSVPAGLDHDAVLAALAPRPVCVGAAASDHYFPVEGARAAVERARRVYDAYDAADRVDLAVADAGHCPVYEFREDIFAWLCDRLGDVDYDPDGHPETVDPADLHCTPEGNVLDAYDDERTIDAIIAESVDDRHPDAGSGRTPDVDPERLRRRLDEQFCVDRDDCDLHPRYVGRSEDDGLDVARVWFRTERDPDAVVAGVLVSVPDASPDAPAVVLYEDGTGALSGRGDDVAALAREHGAALVFDPRGVGAVENREIPVPNWASDAGGTFDTEFKLANDALLLGDSLFGMRVSDVRRAATFLREVTGADRVSLVGEGTGAYHALYAAALLRDVDSVAPRGLGPSFYERATEREAPFDPALTVFDVVENCDVPHVLAALDRRNVAVDASAR